MNLVEVDNRTRTALDEAAVARLVAAVLRAEGVHDAEVAVGFVGEARIRSLNREYRGRDEVTDVLSFPLEDPPEPDADADAGTPRSASRGAADKTGPPRLLGDILICVRRALGQARADGTPLALELSVLLAHGTLHLLGYDHESDAGQMALRQAEVLEHADWEGLVVAPR